MMTSFVILLLVCLLPGQVSSEGYSKKLYDFLTIANGAFDNSDQYQKWKSEFDFAEVRLIPVAVPDSNSVCLFLEEVINGKYVRVHANLLTEDSSGTITLTMYNVTKPSLYKKSPGTITPAEISSLKREDLSLFHQCSARFQAVGDDSFFGAWQNCLEKKDGYREHYSIYFGCDRYFVIVLPNGPEKGSLLPYDMRRKQSPRFPIPGASASFPSLCDKKY